mmetsp:Transcript_21446/g.37648  ORF Transcript_21446/g.37648 Transcript_21446/m.37648 type:complete len:108 (+) Transcript_21446:458-781(+)
MAGLEPQRTMQKLSARSILHEMTVSSLQDLPHTQELRCAVHHTCRTRPGRGRHLAQTPGKASSMRCLLRRNGRVGPNFPPQSVTLVFGDSNDWARLHCKVAEHALGF